MLDLIEDILLSDILIIIVLLIMLVAVTRWAMSSKDYPAYALGWLIGIFFIVISRSLTGDDTAELQDTAEATETTLTFFAAMLPAIFGIIAGGGIMFAIRRFAGQAGAGKSVSIAVSTATLIIVLFILATAGTSTRQIISILALAFAIGALSAYVLKLGVRAPRTSVSRYATQNIPAAKVDPRLEQHRRRYDE